MKNYDITIVIEKDEDGNYLAICPSLQGCYAEGSSEEEVTELIEDAIRLHIEDRLENNEPVYEEVKSKKISIAI